MEEITIRGKKFNKEDVEKRGTQQIKKISNKYRWVGVVLFLIGLIPFVSLLIVYKGHLPTQHWAFFITLMFPPMLIGFIFFCISFKSRNAVEYGIKEIERELPEPDKAVNINFNVDNDSKKMDKFDEIKRYKELLDAGIITVEEFEEKKRELL